MQIFFYLAAAALAFSAVASAADPAREVRCSETGFSLALEAQDRERFAAYIDPDARFFSARVLRGPDEILAGWDAFFQPGGPRLKWRPMFVEVIEQGTLALSRGPYSLLVRDEDGSERESWGTFNSVWRRGADGQWRVVFDAGGPATETPDEQTRNLMNAPAGDCQFARSSD